MQTTVKWLIGKPDAKTGDSTHALQSTVTHVVVDKAGNHTAYAGDPKTSTPIPITKEQWWDLQGIKKE